MALAHCAALVSCGADVAGVCVREGELGGGEGLTRLGGMQSGWRKEDGGRQGLWLLACAQLAAGS